MDLSFHFAGFTALQTLDCRRENRMDFDNFCGDHLPQYFIEFITYPSLGCDRGGVGRRSQLGDFCFGPAMDRAWGSKFASPLVWTGQARLIHSVFLNVPFR